ncbi:hypothetical protein GW17_00060797 [Ensete ventricosum]|nr:hypothetical protein GW17_00060797 [Ensete ventricosum]
MIDARLITIERKIQSEVWLRLSPDIGPGLGRCSRELAGSTPRAHRLEACRVRWKLAESIRSLSGVCWEHVEGDRELARMASGSSQEEDRETRWKIIGGNRKAYRELERFAEGIGKLAGNTQGDHWKKTERLATRMTEVARLAGREPLFYILVGKPLVSDECTIAAQAFGWLAMSKPPKVGG